MADAPLVLLPKHKQEMNEFEARRELGRTVSGEEAHRIQCPYEPVGAAITTVRRKLGAVEFPVGEVLKCDTCNRYFKVGLQIHLVGKPLEDG